MVQIQPTLARILMMSITLIPKQVLEWLGWEEASVLNPEKRIIYPAVTKLQISVNKLIIIPTIIMEINQVRTT